MEGSSDEEPSEGNPQIRFREGGIETMHGIRIVRHKKGNLETEFKAEPKQRSLFLYSTKMLPTVGWDIWFKNEEKEYFVQLLERLSSGFFVIINALRATSSSLLYLLLFYPFTSYL
jgi:hypothetical protein